MWCRRSGLKGLVRDGYMEERNRGKYKVNEQQISNILARLISIANTGLESPRGILYMNSMRTKLQLDKSNSTFKTMDTSLWHEFMM
jgi:hypothetical protein